MYGTPGLKTVNENGNEAAAVQPDYDLDDFLNAMTAVSEDVEAIERKVLVSTFAEVMANFSEATKVFARVLEETLDPIIDADAMA